MKKQKKTVAVWKDIKPQTKFVGETKVFCIQVYFFSISETLDKNHMNYSIKNTLNTDLDYEIMSYFKM